MRRTAPLILGAGPAGCAAAIVLAQAGAQPLLIERDAVIGDALCGGFLSWRTAARLETLGIDFAALGAQRITHLAIFAAERHAELPLPDHGHGLSRLALDTALRAHALELGADLAIDRIRRIEGTTLVGQQQEWSADSLFLASGKHDVLGMGRPRSGHDPALGLRLRVRPSESLHALIAGRIELHLFEGGYAGVVLQEGGTANICMALRKSLLADAGGDPRALLARLAAIHPALGERMVAASPDTAVDTIGAVPYGWIARSTLPGLFRLGDQAAVIPSLAGEGIAIALASGSRAAQAWLDSGPAAAPAFQRDFARSACRPLAMAGLLRAMAERPSGSALVNSLARRAPWLLRLAARLTRLD
jgi:flavin-dependent dehydrogenase